MTDGRWSRRDLLRAGAAAGSVAASGCLSGDPPGCGDEDVAVVYRSLLSGWYVDYPANDGLLESGDEVGDAPARRLARLAREEGYTVEYYFAEDLGRGTDDEWQVELYGDLDRGTVERLVREADMPEGTDVTPRTASISRGSGLKWPWAPGLLEGRAAFLAEHAQTVGVDLPAFGPATGETVSLAESTDAGTRAWIRGVLSGRSVLTVDLRSVPDDGNALNEFRASNYYVPERDGEDGEFEHDRSAVGLSPDGTVETGTYIRSLLHTMYRPRREDDLALVDGARLRIGLDGEVIEERPPNDRERSYLRAYARYIDRGDLDREAPEPPRLALTTLAGREALRAAALLRWPTAVRFGVAVERCR